MVVAGVDFWYDNYGLRPWQAKPKPKTLIHSRSVYSQTRLADFGYIPERKPKNPRGLNEVSLPLARMVLGARPV